MEIFKPILGYEHLYEISNYGNVKTLGNFPKLRNKVFGYLKPGLVRGYQTVILTNKNGKRTSYLVHRLVAIAFLPNPKNYRCVNHIDENKSNNKLENLEWCSDQQNKEHSSRKSFSFKNKDGLVVSTPNMSRFCREHGLQQGNLSKVVAGTRTHHRGWSLA